jgi:putative transposase
MILAALHEAQIAGARVQAACQVIGVSPRTIQRWTRHPDIDDRRCGPRHRPGNALSAREETQVLALMTSAEYGHLSPKQLVPRLADKAATSRRSRRCTAYDVVSDWARTVARCFARR